MVSIASTKYQPTKVGKSSFPSSSVLLRFKDHRRRGRREGRGGRSRRATTTSSKEKEEAEWQNGRSGGREDVTAHARIGGSAEEGREGEDEE